MHSKRSGIKTNNLVWCYKQTVEHATSVVDVAAAASFSSAPGAGASRGPAETIDWRGPRLSFRRAPDSGAVVAVGDTSQRHVGARSGRAGPPRADPGGDRRLRRRRPSRSGSWRRA